MPTGRSTLADQHTRTGLHHLTGCLHDKDAGKEVHCSLRWSPRVNNPGCTEIVKWCPAQTSSTGSFLAVEYCNVLALLHGQLSFRSGLECGSEPARMA